jgi:hypothetical protein
LSSFLCFFLAMRLRRFLTTDPNFSSKLEHVSMALQ